MSYLLGASFIFMVINMVRAWFGGERAVGNPWGARTLEWQTTSPPPVENFDAPPEVTGDPYGYGTPEAPAHSSPATGTVGN
jgi:cytochrome c oxidase subunit 1